MMLNELLADIGKIESELHRFETRFGVRSQEFYIAITKGELSK